MGQGRIVQIHVSWLVWAFHFMLHHRGKGRMHHRLGLSRVNVLVALLVVAVVGGLLLGVITRVREAADRIKCTNNLKQIVLSAHNYESRIPTRLPPLTD